MSYSMYGNPHYTGDVKDIISSKLEFYNLYNPYGLYYYQEFVRRFMSPYMNLKQNLLLFHSLGSGKTSTCISIMVDHFKHNGRKTLIIGKNIYGKHVFRTEFSRYCLNYPDSKNFKLSDMCQIISYIELSNRICNISNRDITKKYSGMLIIMDEIHNIKYEEEEYTKVYIQLKRLINNSNDIQVILSTATPMIDNVTQFKSIVELVDNLYISYNNVVQSIPDHMYHGEKIYENIHPVVMIPMIKSQLYYYDSYSTDIVHDVYRSDSQISLFCSTDGYYGPSIISNMMTKVRCKDNIVTRFGTFKHITYSKYKILDKYINEITLLLPETSCKYYYLIEHLENPKNKGTFFVYIEEVMGSGIMLLSEILEHYGYELYLGDSIDNIHKAKRYTYCVGDSELCSNIEDRINGFCNFNNSDGEYVKVLIGSRIIGEAITLRNVRHVHCITPHWNENVINQVIGRVLRSNSHVSLKTKDRFVNIYIYCAVSNNVISVDSHKLRLSNNKQKDILTKIDDLKNRSIEQYQPKNTPSDIATFMKYYFNLYKPMLFNILDTYLLSRSTEIYDINDIIRNMQNIDPRIVKQLLIVSVVSNRILNNHYFRFYLDKIILVDDFNNIPFILTEKINYEIKASKTVKIPVIQTNMDIIVNKSFDTLDDIKNLSISEIKLTLEHAIMTNNADILNIFKYCIIEYKDIITHTILYSENLNNAYKAAIPFPKTPTGYLKGYINGQWEIISEVVEQQIIDILKRDFINLFHSVSEQPIYGIFSVIDKRMRISLGMTEYIHEDNKVDRRDKHRGRVITTILKPDLVIITGILQTPEIFRDITLNKRRFGSLEEIDDYYNMKDIKNNYMYDTNIKLSVIIEQELVRKGMFIVI